MSLALQISGVTKSFRDVTAIENVSADVNAGGVCLLLGESGAGKTTLLRLIAGLDRPDSGSISYGANVWCSDRAYVKPWRRSLAMVFQDQALWPHMTVGQHLEFSAKKNQAGDVKYRMDSLVDRLSLGELVGRYPSMLSGGQKQRLSIARALVVGADVVLYDEPFNNLSEHDVGVVRELIESLRQKGDSLQIVATHSSFAEDDVDVDQVIRLNPIVRKD